jgi:hypothetical protein
VQILLEHKSARTYLYSGWPIGAIIATAGGLRALLITRTGFQREKREKNLLCLNVKGPTGTPASIGPLD